MVILLFILATLIPSKLVLAEILVLNNQEVSLVNYPYLFDKGALTEVQTKQFTANKKPSLGVHLDPVWLKIRVLNASSEKKEFVLRFRKKYHNYVTMFFKNKEIRSGTGIQPENRPLSMNTMAFPFELSGNEAQDIFLKFSSYHLLNISASVMPRNVFETKYQAVETSFKGGYYAVISLIIVISFLVFVLFKNRKFLWYSFYLLSILLSNAGLDGLISFFYWSDQDFFQRYMLNFIVTLSSAVAVFFAYQILKDRLSPFAARLYHFFIATNLIFSFLMVIPIHHQFIELRNLVMIASIVYIVASMIFFRRKDLPDTLQIAGWSIYILSVIIAILDSEASIAATFLREIAVQIGSLVEFIFLSMSLVLRIRMSEIEKHKAKIESEKLSFHLSSAMSQARLSEIIQREVPLNFRPKNVELSIMFIDIVKFSKIIDRLESPELLHSIKTYVHDIKELVFKHQGVVNNVMGDGLFCFFGYDIGGLSDSDHRIHCLKCAIDIQRMSIDLQKLNKESEPFLAVRVGIHAGSAWLFDYSIKGPPNLTILGDDVNFAQRLESAASLNKISASKAMLKQLSFANSCYSKHIKIKHNSELIEVFEIDPHTSNNEEDQVMALFHEKFKFSQNEERKTTCSPLPIQVEESMFFINDYSLHGFQAEGNLLIGQGVEIRIYFLSLALHTILGTVRWARVRNGRYEHGIEYLNKDRQLLDSIYSHIESKSVSLHAN